MPTKSKSSTITKTDRRIYTREEIDAGMIDFSDIATGGRLPPVHPGNILMEDFLKPMALTPYRFAKLIKVPLNRVTAIIDGKRAISVDTAMRFGRFFSTSTELWLGLQQQHDLDVANDRLSKRIAREVQPFVATAKAA